MNPTNGPTTNPTKPAAPHRGTPRATPTKPAGWIYLDHTWDDPHKYVGQTRRPVWQRVNEERKTMPWGPQIKPGRDGYTILRRVESSGNPAIDAILLDLAEAEEIARWVPSDNVNRPDPEVFVGRLADAYAGRPTSTVGTPRRPTVGTPRTAPRGSVRSPRTTGRGVPWAVVGWAALAVLWAVVGVAVFGDAPSPRTPWVAVPVMTVLGPALTVGMTRRAFGGRPKRRRRRRH